MAISKLNVIDTKKQHSIKTYIIKKSFFKYLIEIQIRNLKKGENTKKGVVID